MTSPYAQDGYRLRCDWGPPGARVIGGDATYVAVIDVLSFTTTLSVAADMGVEVFPYRWRDASAEAFAREHDAVLAVGRSKAGPGQVSLSPVTVRGARGLRTLVLPSPNGSTIAHEMAAAGRTVLGVSLRNAAAAAAWTAQRLRDDESAVPIPPHRTPTRSLALAVPIPPHRTPTRSLTLAHVAVIPAGERWRDGSLRPAVEDLWGAGAYLAALVDHGVGPASPEARNAMAAYRDVSTDLPRWLRDSASGRELVGAGYGEDVEIAAEVGESDVVPVLTGASFTPVPSSPPPA